MLTAYSLPGKSATARKEKPEVREDFLAGKRTSLWLGLGNGANYQTGFSFQRQGR